MFCENSLLLLGGWNGFFTIKWVKYPCIYDQKKGLT
jgi:hypothetical protein